jgi:hypothetical protein
LNYQIIKPEVVVLILGIYFLVYISVGLAELIQEYRLEGKEEE